MTFLELKPFFNNHIVWRSDLEFYWYEEMWDVLTENETLSATMKKNRQEPCLLAIALVDLYREFVQHAEDEYWSEGELAPELLQGCNYEEICAWLDIPLQTIYDLYSEEEVEYEGWNAEAIQEILLKERSTLSEVYFEHAASKYRYKILSAIKQKYDLSDLFSLMVNTFASNRYSQHRFLEDDDYIEEPIESGADFIRSAFNNQDDFLDDMDLIRGYEWVSMVY